MSKTIFDFEVRTLECASCGGPIEAPKTGGHVVCGFCRATNHVTERSADERANRRPSMVEEVARLSRLKAQLSNPVSGHVYDMDRPPHDWGGLDPAGPGGVARLKSAWAEAKASAGAPGSPQRDQRTTWVALRLAEHHRRTRDPLQARAVLETSLDLVQDAGLHHLVRCRLASEAVRERDFAAARGWLDECDPAPEVLELDSAYREARARLHVAERKFNEVLDVLGRRRDDVPIDPSVDFDASLLRIHALELSASPQGASEELDRAAGMHGEERVIFGLTQEQLAPGTRARKQLEARAQLRRTLLSYAERRARFATGLRALPPALAKAPFIAAALMVLVAVPRCTLDIDPLMGVQGYALCPSVCNGCEGPTWVMTEWNQTGPGEYTSDGAEYYCMPPPPTPPARDARYEMSWVAAFGSSYGLLLLLVLPLVPLLAYAGHMRAVNARRSLDDQLEDLAQRLGEPVPRVQGPSMLKPLAMAVTLFGGLLAASAVLTYVAL